MAGMRLTAAMTTQTCLPGRRALVIGGDRGIGAATVRRLAGKGADVVFDFVGDAARAEALAAEVRERGGRAIPVAGDVGDERNVARLFRQAAEALDRPVDLP